MNGFKLLNEDNSLLQIIPLDTLIYLYLISEVEASRGKLVSKWYVDVVYNTFKNYKEKEVDEAISTLISLGLVEDNKRYYVVGTVDDGGKKLFTSTKVDLSKEFSLIINRAKEFALISGLGKRIVRELEDFKLTYQKADLEGMLKLWRCCYEAVFEDSFREFSGKDRGQMKNLMQYYSKEVLIKLIIYYTLNCEKYPVTSIGYLIQNCDAVYADAMKITKTKRDKDYTDESGF